MKKLSRKGGSFLFGYGPPFNWLPCFKRAKFGPPSWFFCWVCRFFLDKTRPVDRLVFINGGTESPQHTRSKPCRRCNTLKVVVGRL